MTTSATRSRGGVLVGCALLLAVWVVPMGLSGTAVALPAISAELGADRWWLQVVVNGFNVAFAGFTLLWGAFSDRFGHRSTFRLGVALYLAAAILTACAASLPLVAVARTLAGAAGAAVFTGAAASISHVFDGSARTRMFALYGATIGLGLAAGPSIAGALLSAFGWRSAFLAHAVLLVLALIGSALIPRGNAGDSAPARGAMRALLARPRFVAMCLVAVAGSIAFVTMLTYLPTAFGAVLGLDGAMTGVWMLALTVPVFCGPFAGEWIARRVRTFAATGVIVLGLVLLVAGLTGMLLLAPDRSPGLLVLPMLLIGSGFGLSLGLVDGEALSAAPAHASGSAAGVRNFFRMGSAAVFVGLHGALVAVGVGAGRPPAGTADRIVSGEPLDPPVYSGAFGVSVTVLLILLLVTVAAAVLLLRREPAPRVET